MSSGGAISTENDRHYSLSPIPSQLSMQTEEMGASRSKYFERHHHAEEWCCIDGSEEGIIFIRAKPIIWRDKFSVLSA